MDTAVKVLLVIVAVVAVIVLWPCIHFGPNRANAYVINGPHSPMPYRIQDPYARPRPIPHPMFIPPHIVRPAPHVYGYIPRPYGGNGYVAGMASARITGYRAQSFSYSSRMCHDYRIVDGVKFYTRHYAC